MLMTPSQIPEQELLDSFKKHRGNPYAVATELSLTPSQAMARLRALEVRPDFGVQYEVYLIDPPKDLGRESLRPFIVSARHSLTTGWPLADRDAIERARSDYDAGLIEMFQGRDGPWYIQYAKPRRHRDSRRAPWFSQRSVF